jgi:hypothetical protein
MNKNSKPDEPFKAGEMLAEYDFSRAVRGNLRDLATGLRAKIETQTGDRQVLIKTVVVTAVVNGNGEVTIQLPADISPGEHHITLLIEQDDASGRKHD